MYYNVNNETLNLDEYNFIYTAKIGFTSDYQVLLQRESNRVVNALLLLLWDANMFHQANLDVTSQPITTLANGQTGQFSLLMTWVEYITTQYMQLVNWPIITVKQDDLYQLFMDRMQRDQCGYQLYARVVNNQVIGATLSSTSACKVPVTVPMKADASTESGKVFEQLAVSDLITYWVDLVAGVQSVFTWSAGIVWN